MRTKVYLFSAPVPVILPPDTHVTRVLNSTPLLQNSMATMFIPWRCGGDFSSKSFRASARHWSNNSGPTSQMSRGCYIHLRLWWASLSNLIISKMPSLSVKYNLQSSQFLELILVRRRDINKIFRKTNAALSWMGSSGVRSSFGWHGIHRYPSSLSIVPAENRQIGSRGRAVQSFHACLGPSGDRLKS